MGQRPLLATVTWPTPASTLAPGLQSPARPPFAGVWTDVHTTCLRVLASVLATCLVDFLVSTTERDKDTFYLYLAILWE